MTQTGILVKCMLSYHGVTRALGNLLSPVHRVDLYCTPLLSNTPNHNMPIKTPKFPSFKWRQPYIALYFPGKGNHDNGNFPCLHFKGCYRLREKTGGKQIAGRDQTMNCLSPSLTTHHLSSVAVLCQVRRASHLHVESTLNTGEERDPSRAAFSLLMANLLIDCDSSVLSSSLRMLSPATPPCCEHERLLCASKGGNR